MRQGASPNPGDTGRPGSSGRTGPAVSTTPVATDQAVAMSTAPHRGHRASRAPSSTTSPTPYPAGRTSGTATPPTSGPSWSSGGPGPGFAPAQLRFANGARVEVLMPWDVEVNDFLSRFLAGQRPGRPPPHVQGARPGRRHRPGPGLRHRAGRHRPEPPRVDGGLPPPEGGHRRRGAVGRGAPVVEQPGPRRLPHRPAACGPTGRGRCRRPRSCRSATWWPTSTPASTCSAGCSADGRSARARPTGCAGSTWPGPGRWASGWSVPTAPTRPVRWPSGSADCRDGSTTCALEVEEPGRRARSGAGHLAVRTRSRAATGRPAWEIAAGRQRRARAGAGARPGPATGPAPADR